MHREGVPDAAILCGGLGKRLRRAAAGRPKAMVRIRQRPFLDFLLAYLYRQGFRRFILCTGYKGEFIEGYYQRKEFPFEVEFSCEDEPLGTGGAIKKAFPLVTTGSVLVANGDSFCQFNGGRFQEFHRVKSAVVSMIVTGRGTREDCGSVRVDGSGKITGFTEKAGGKGGKLVNAGVYLFTRRAFSEMPKSRAFSLEDDFFPSMIGNDFYGYRARGPLIDIGTPRRYYEANKKLGAYAKGLVHF